MSWRFSREDHVFIQENIDKLLNDGVIRPKSSPYRAQVLVVEGEENRSKRRLCIDYSQPRFTRNKML